jgi:hypothetical protein
MMDLHVLILLNYKFTKVYLYGCRSTCLSEMFPAVKRTFQCERLIVFENRVKNLWARSVYVRVKLRGKLTARIEWPWRFGTTDTEEWYELMLTDSNIKLQEINRRKYCDYKMHFVHLTTIIRLVRGPTYISGKSYWMYRPVFSTFRKPSFCWMQTSFSVPSSEIL